MPAKGWAGVQEFVDYIFSLDAIFLLQMVLLLYSLWIFLKAWRVRANIRRLEKEGIIAGLKEAEEIRRDPEQAHLRAITLSLGAIKTNIDDADIPYYQERLLSLGAEFNDVKRFELGPSASLKCEIFLRKHPPPKAEGSKFAVFGEPSSESNGVGYAKLFVISENRRDFQFPPIELQSKQRQTGRDFSTLYHGTTKYKESSYDVAVYFTYYF
ncbi:MAG: hypothetical protein AAGC77_03550 [Pseudomonadota bacterium]